MPITELEVIAGLRILVAIVKADGTVHGNERAALAAALEEARLSEGRVTVDSLLAETVDLEGVLGAVEDPAARDGIYKGAFAMAYADGSCTRNEQVLLDQVRETWKISDEQAMFVARPFAETTEWVLPSKVTPIEDPAARSKEIRHDVLKYARMSGLLGALGDAIATDLAILAVQLKVVRDVAMVHGHRVRKTEARSLLLGLGLGGARMAMSNVIKLVRGSTSDAATSFAETFALGKVMGSYFGEGAKADAAELAEDFEAAKDEGESAYAEHEGSLDALEAHHMARVRQLTAELNDGTLTLEEVARDLSALDWTPSS